MPFVPTHRSPFAMVSNWLRYAETLAAMSGQQTIHDTIRVSYSIHHIWPSFCRVPASVLPIV